MDILLNLFNIQLCGEYKYWEARDFVYERLKGRPDQTGILQRQVMKIYFFMYVNQWNHMHFYALRAELILIDLIC